MISSMESLPKKEPVVHAAMESKFNVQIADMEASFSGQFDQLKKQIEERGQPDLSWGKDEFGPLDSSPNKEGGENAWKEIQEDFDVDDRTYEHQQVDKVMQQVEVSETFDISQSLDALK